jgi:phosphate transport system protein
MPGSHHIVKSFDEELGKLQDAIARMGGLAEAQLAGFIQAITERDGEAAARVVAEDAKVDALDAQVNDMAVRLLALRNPVADDLRVVITALKMSGELERVADHAASSAKRVLVLNQMPPIGSVRAVARMGWLVVAMIKDVLDAYMNQDAEKALAVWGRDGEVDDLYSSVFRELLTYMLEDPRNITACTHLMFVAKNLERVGDHATNIAEMTHYLVTGQSLRKDRPKRDVTSQAVAEPRG